MIEQTEALVSIDVNGGHGMFGQGNSQEKAILEVNLTAARQVCDTYFAGGLHFHLPSLYGRTSASKIALIIILFYTSII